MQDVAIDLASAVMPTTVKRFEDGDTFNTANNTTYATPLASSIGALSRTCSRAIANGTADTGGGVSAPLDSFTTTSFVSSATIKVTATNLKNGDVVIIAGQFLVNGDVATTSVEMQLHDGTARVPGWGASYDTAGGLPNGGASNHYINVPVYARYAVTADAASKTFTLQGKKLNAGHNAASTHSPWTLTATVLRA